LAGSSSRDCGLSRFSAARVSRSRGSENVPQSGSFSCCFTLAGRPRDSGCSPGELTRVAMFRRH